MNLFTKKLCFVLVSTAVVLTGCSKKPKRPDPSQTVLGTGAGGGLNPDNLGNLGGTDGNPAPGTGLDPRGAGGIDGQIRGQLESVYFDFNQSGIKASERPKLQAAQKYLSEHPEFRILLEGHCDWRGTAEYNLGLGDRRANAAKQFIESLGVTADKVEVLSKGDLDSIENADEGTMAKDRRVELVLLKQ